MDIMFTTFTEKISKNIPKYFCKDCDFKCDKKSIWDKHILTRKHINVYKCLPIISNEKIFTCDCGKIYKYRQSLYVHKKICIKDEKETINIDSSKNDLNILTNLVLEVIKSNTELHKQNQDLQKQVLEVCKNIQPSIINTNSNIITNSNNNNKTFNLQVFLNEECKDAMNIKDFMNSFVLQIKDLENVGKLGYVDGITDIIVQKLNELDVKQRPMHCSDSKRETIYIKDEGIWEKEGPANNKVKKVVGHVSKHNLNLLNSWKDLHPCCLNSNSPHNGHYLHLIKESLGGPEDMNLTESKIVKKISREIIIDKK
jgi:hypothetical protein